MIRTVAVYARVSTDGQTTVQQLDRLRSAALGAREFVDQARSGRASDRPAFLELRAAIVAGELEAVYAVKLDRLGRSVRGLIEFFELADAHQVRVVLLDQQIDTSTPVGRALRNMLAVVAELETELITDRTRAAMRAFKEGTRTPRAKIGRPARVNAELLQQIQQLRTDGLTWSKIALRLHIPATSARKWFSNAKRAAGAPPAEKGRVINGRADFGAPRDGSQPASPAE